MLKLDPATKIIKIKLYSIRLFSLASFPFPFLFQNERRNYAAPDGQVPNRIKSSQMFLSVCRTQCYQFKPINNYASDNDEPTTHGV